MGRELCSIIPLVSLLFAVLVSLHPDTFLMFLLLVLIQLAQPSPISPHESRTRTHMCTARTTLHCECCCRDTDHGKMFNSIIIPLLRIIRELLLSVFRSTRFFSCCCCVQTFSPLRPHFGERMLDAGCIQGFSKL